MFNEIDVVKLILFKKHEPIIKAAENLDFEEFEVITPKTVKLNSLVVIGLKRNGNNKTITNKCQEINYFIVSRSMILNSGITKYCNTPASSINQISFYATILHSPFTNIILYYLNEDKELFVQTKDIKIEQLYNNMV